MFSSYACILLECIASVVFRCNFYVFDDSFFLTNCYCHQNQCAINFVDHSYLRIYCCRIWTMHQCRQLLLLHQCIQKGFYETRWLNSCCEHWSWGWEQSWCFKQVDENFFSQVIGMATTFRNYSVCYMSCLRSYCFYSQMCSWTWLLWNLVLFFDQLLSFPVYLQL